MSDTKSAMKDKKQRARGIWLTFAWLPLLVPNLARPQVTSKATQDRLIADAQTEIKALSGRFAEILAPDDRENKLRTACKFNCGDVADTGSGKTVGDELHEIAVAKDAAMDRVAAEIGATLDDYIVHTVGMTDPKLSSATVATRLRLILGDEAVQPPAAFLLRSAKSSSVLVFYGLNRGMTIESTTVLRAYTFDAGSLRLKVSVGTDMDNYGNLEVSELHSPEPDEIWLLVSGQRLGANGPNIRMRVFAFDGKRFRTMWMPAEQWGDFRTHVTQDGFTVDGDYYRSNLHRHEAYSLASDGIYLKQPGE